MTTTSHHPTTAACAQPDVRRAPRHAALAAAVAASVLLAACQVTTVQRNTMIGTGVGAVAGAGIASATGGKAGVGAAAGAAIGALGSYIWSTSMERQRQELEAATQGTGVSVVRTPDNQLKLDIPADISFDTGSAVVKPQFQPLLNRFAESLRKHPNTDVIIIGHTDSTGTHAVNETLSLHRANATRDYIFRQGVTGPRIRTEGRGSSQPVASNDTAAGRSRNRRVEIFLSETAR